MSVVVGREREREIEREIYVYIYIYIGLERYGERGEFIS